MASELPAAWRGPSRAVPPPLVEPVLQRARLEALLDDAARRRLVTVVADAGFGKSTLLAAWAQGRPAAWYTVTRADADLGAMATGVVEALSLRTPALISAVGDRLATGAGPDARADESLRAGAQAALVSEALETLLSRDLVLVLDDLSEIGPEDPAARFIEALVRMAPPRLHVVIASRDDPPFPVQRLRGRGQVVTITGAQLAFREDESRQLLTEMLGEEPAMRLTPTLQQATGGWPAAVRLAAEALRGIDDREREATLARMLSPGGPILDYLAAEALSHAGADVRELLRAVAPLRRFTAGVCEALGVRHAARTIAASARRGLFIQPIGDGEWHELHPLARELASSALELSPEGSADEVVRVRRTAATWFADHGNLIDALDCLQSAGDHAQIATLLTEHGDRILAEAGPDAVIGALSGMPAVLRTLRITELEGEARQLRGDWDGALVCFQEIAGDAESMPAGVAWRLGLILHLRGRLDEALDAYGRGRLDGTFPGDEAMLRAWWASALWLRGEVAASEALANEALSQATEAGDESALAAAHTVLAMLAALASDRRANDAHYLRALGHATRARDALQAIRIHANRGSHFAEEGYYAEALAELDEAIDLADLAGFAAFRALALSNRGEVLFRLGRLDEAIAELEASRAIYQRLESRLVAYPLGHLGEVYRERGDMALARSQHEEAIRIAEEANDLQGLVPSLGGLARVIVRTEPDRAIALAERAVGYGPVLGHIGALLALAWVRLAIGQLDGARSAAADAERLARERRDRAGLAEAIELAVRTAPNPSAERDRLDEALALWEDLGSPLGEARVRLAMAELLPAEQARPMAEAARQRFAEIGARRGVATATALLDRLAEIGPADVQIRTLGGFEVLRHGRSVPLAEWRSRKARDLLKLLVTARGQRVPREQLMETLWPDDDPERSGPRLSVVLSTARAVLDPEKRQPADHFIAADRAAARLCVNHLPVDLETFEADATRGLALAATGEQAGAALALAAAEAAYRGDFLNEDPYDDAATATREEARALYARVTRTLAGLAAERGEVDVAAGYLRRVLERDPYDEPAHLELVRLLTAAARHGEARRAYRAYTGRMEELGVEAAPFGATS